jgi:hypothetical protein
VFCLRHDTGEEEVVVVVCRSDMVGDIVLNEKQNRTGYMKLHEADGALNVRMYLRIGNSWSLTAHSNKRPISVAALGLRVRILLGAWMSFSCKCCVLLDTGICVGLITRPEESSARARARVCP